MRRGIAQAALLAAAVLAALPALAASAPPAPIGGEEIAVTYAQGELQFFEAASGARGSTIGLPLMPGATALQVQGGAYTRSRGAVLVDLRSSSVVITYRVPTANNVDRLVELHSPSAVRQILLLTGPGVHPSGLGIAPFRLLGSVPLAGKVLTGFRADNLPAGTTVRWEFEIGQPGYLLADLLRILMLLVPLLAIAGVLRGLLMRRAVTQAAREQDETS